MLSSMSDEHSKSSSSAAASWPKSSGRARSSISDRMRSSVLCDPLLIAESACFGLCVRADKSRTERSLPIECPIVLKMCTARSKCIWAKATAPDDARVRPLMCSNLANKSGERGVAGAAIAASASAADRYCSFANRASAFKRCTSVPILACGSPRSIRVILSLTSIAWEFFPSFNSSRIFVCSAQAE